MQRQLVKLEDSLSQLQMQIFFMANDFSRRRALQNFQYSLMPAVWRVKHDKLFDENIQSLIAKRTTTGIWNPNNVTVWTIRSYYLDEYLKQSQNVDIVFGNAKEFLEAFHVLRFKSFRTLLQVNLLIKYFNKTIHSFIS